MVEAVIISKLGTLPWPGAVLRYSAILSGLRLSCYACRAGEAYSSGVSRQFVNRVDTRAHANQNGVKYNIRSFQVEDLCARG